MLSTLLRLKDIEVITKNKQKLIKAGGGPVECEFSDDPETDWCCHLPSGC